MIIKLFDALNRWIFNLGEYNYFKEILKSAKRSDLIQKTIVFNSVRNFRRSFDHEVFFGIILALNGANVKILLDDGILMHWDVAQVDKIKNIKKIEKKNLNPYYFLNVYENYFSNFQITFRIFFRRILRKKARKTFKVENLEYIHYSDIINENNIEYKKFKGLINHAKSSTIRFFKTSDLDYKDNAVLYYYKLSLKNAFLSRAVGQYVLKELKPDLFVTSAGLYSTYGPAYEFLRQNGVKCLISATGLFVHSINPSLTYYSDVIPQKLSSSKFWANYKETIVTEEMKKRVEKYFIERTKGIAVDMKAKQYFERGMYLKINKSDGYKYHIAMFPNVLWDGNIKDRHIAFNGYLDWILSTINYVRNRKDIKLYIKAHPGEIKYRMNKGRILTLIKKYTDLKNVENIILISPEQKINTYEFLKSGIDLGIIYDGFLGLEMPYLKIPTITCVKDGFAAIKNGNFTVSTKEEYFDYLNNIEKHIEDFHNNYDKYYYNIVKYIYWYIFENPVKLPIISHTRDGSIGHNLMKLTKNDFIIEKKLLDLFNQ